VPLAGAALDELLPPHPAAAMPRASTAIENTANLGIFILASCLQWRRRPGRYCAHCSVRDTHAKPSEIAPAAAFIKA
jgi:hypothetical protein